MRRALFVALMGTALLSACAGKSGIDPDQDQRDAARAQKNCDDPKWKEAHLGVWYSICRPNDALK
jgi:hypothetical protein